MSTDEIGSAVLHAMEAADLSQRALAGRTGISQTTLSRIVNGTRTPTMPELVSIADATGYTTDLLTGNDTASRVEYAARATNGSGMERMKARLLYFADLNRYLDDQSISER